MHLVLLELLPLGVVRVKVQISWNPVVHIAHLHRASYILATIPLLWAIRVWLSLIGRKRIRSILKSVLSS